jgi:cell division septation protein DedD
VKPIKANKLSVSLTSENIKWDFPPIPTIKVLATPYYANTEHGDRIEIMWDSVEAAETYDVYRKTADTDWVYLSTVSKDADLSYVDTAIETDVTYYYSVKGISADRDSLFDDKGFEAMLKGPVEPIEDIFAQLSDDPTDNGKKAVTLAWEANENVALYKVMRKTGADGEWELIGVFLSCELLVFTDYSIEQGIEYTYTIHTYAPDRPSVDNMVGKTITWPSDNPPAQDTTTDNRDETTTTPETTEPDATEPETTTPDTTTPETTVPETTEPTSKPEETTDDSSLDIPDA